jgi:hypothetical protein
MRGLSFREAACLVGKELGPYQPKSAADTLWRYLEGQYEMIREEMSLIEWASLAISKNPSLYTYEERMEWAVAAVAAADDTALALSKTFEETLKAEKQANEFDLAWAKIEQQDRNLEFKLTAEIAIAQIQQGTELVKAAFESINVGIKSTGDALSELAKIFAQLNSGEKASEIEDLLNQENKRRQQEFDLQKQLTDSQIAYLNAVTDRLNSGDATIQIDTTGVEPILRELLFSVMKQVQIQASSEAQLLLLGLT